MKRLFLLMLVIVCIVSTANLKAAGQSTNAKHQPQNWGLTAHDFQMSVDLEQQEFKPSDNIKVWITLRNTATFNQILGVTTAYDDNEFQLTDQWGNPVPLKEQPDTSSNRVRSIQFELKAGEMLQDFVDLKEIYDLKAGNEYRLRVTWLFRSHPSLRQSRLLNSVVSFKITSK